MYLKFALKIFLTSLFCTFAWGIVPYYDRLPNDTKPISYDIHLITDVHKSEVKYNGTVQILLKAVSDTNQVVIHSKNLTDIKLNMVELETKKEFDGITYIIDKEKERMVITSNPHPLNLVSGKEYLLTISYKANLCRGARGFCLMFYKDSDENLIPMAASHLSKGFTRTVFPCYDEPALKAKFTISITHANNYTAYSNMPAIGEPIQSGEGVVTTRFMETPPMSTYIVAFAVGNYKVLSDTIENTTVRLLYPPDAKGGQLSFEVAKKVLPLMNEYFEIPYLLPKMDHLSVPSLAARGMENWGLIMYPESVLLNDFGAKFDTMLNINTVIHEMIHNWFGNLVSPAWWSYYWLSEGITSFYAPKFLDLVKPEWDNMEYNIVRRYAGGTWYYPEVCSLSCDAKTYEEFSSTLGPQAYGKGAFLMRMFENTLTEDIFRKGIIKYLKTFQYSSVTEDDLFTSLQEAVRESTIPFFQEEGSLSKAMKSWTRQTSYPLVTVTRDYEKNLFKVEQMSYEDCSTENTDLWWIPISFTTANDSDFENTTVDFIIPGERSLIIDPSEFNKTLSDNDWLILNKEQFGMYRVNYDQKNWELITCALIKDASIVSRYTKAQIIRDVRGLFDKGLVSESILLNVLLYLKNEKDTVPWKEGSTLLSSIHSNLRTHESISIFQNFTADIIEPIFVELGIESKDNETPSTEILRYEIFELACSIGLEECVKSAKHLSEIASNNKTNKYINPDMLIRSYCLSIKYGDENYFQALLTQSINDKNHALLSRALPCSEDKKNLKELLTRTMKMEVFDSILSYIGYSSLGLELILEMVQNNQLEAETLKEEAKYFIYSATTPEQRDQVVNLNEKLGHIFSNETLQEVDSQIANIHKSDHTFSELFKNGENLRTKCFI